MAAKQRLDHDVDLGVFEGMHLEQLFFLFSLLHDRRLCNSFQPQTPLTHGGLFVPTQTVMREVLSPRNSFWSWAAFHINANCPDQPRLTQEQIQKPTMRFIADTSVAGRYDYVIAMYSVRAQLFPDAWYTFMNYGYHDFQYEKDPLPLRGCEEQWRLCIQMYDHLARQAMLEGRDVLEVGCGRGGGARYLARRFKPRGFTALDGSRSNIMFCQAVHHEPNLKFISGRAERLPFPDASFDVMLNVESFNYYSPFESFTREARRVLRPGGDLLITSFDPPAKMMAFEDMFIEAGFEVIKEVDTTASVKRSLRRFLERDMWAIIGENDTVHRKELYVMHFNEEWGGYPAPLLHEEESRYYEFVFRAV